MAKVALLIGVGNYEHPDDLKPLVSAPKDVAAMQRILLNAQMGEFSEVIPLIDPDPMQMQEAIETLYRDRAKDDLVLLFFSGHGIKDDSGKLHFSTRVTRKTPRGELVKSTAVSARFVQEIMGNSRSRRQVMILDCCFSGAFDPALNAKDGGSVDLQNLGAEGRVVLTSSSSTEYSFEQQGSELSIYTRFLVEGIETGAADRDNDGKVSVRELHEYATKKVQETAPKMNPKIIVLKDEGFDVVFAKAQITDPKLKYRKDAERYSMRGAISPAGRTLLNTQRVRLGLTLEETQEIEDQILQPFRDRLKHLEDYRLAFVAEVEYQYPLTQETLDELKDLQEILGLREEDVTQIEQDVTAQIANKSEAYQQKLQRYEQECTKAIQGEFPLSQYACEGLDKFQVALGLTDEDVTRIKQPIIERRTAEHQQQQLEQRRQRDAENLRQQQEAERLQTEQQRAQEYQQKLSQYEREFSRAIRSSFPLDGYAREGLKNFQQALNLKDEDIARLETPLLKTREAEYQKQQAEQLRQQQEAERLQQQEAERLREHQRRQKEESDRQQAELRQQNQTQQFSHQQAEQQSTTDISLRYAGFWRRFTAISIDGVISLTLAINTYEHLYKHLGRPMSYLSPFLLVMVYIVTFESSPLKATVGKLIMGIAVTDLDGNQISLARSIGRYLTWMFPLFLCAIAMLNTYNTSLSIGLWWVVIVILTISFFTSKKKQCLHDYFTKCVVIRR